MRNCTMEETINKVKRQSMEWGETFTNHISDKGQISKIYKEFTQLSSKNQITQLKKWARDLSRQTFPQRRCIKGQQVCDKMLSITML